MALRHDLLLGKLSHKSSNWKVYERCKRQAKPVTGINRTRVALYQRVIGRRLLWTRGSSEKPMKRQLVNRQLVNRRGGRAMSWRVSSSCPTRCSASASGLLRRCGFSAIVALLFVILMPGFRRPDTASSFSADVQQFTAALPPRSQDQQSSEDTAKPAIEQFHPCSRLPASRLHTPIVTHPTSCCASSCGGA
jgi:hypothetical protein